MLKLINVHHCTCLKSVFVGLGRGSAVEVLSTLLKKAEFWAILHCILYPNKVTLLNKLSVSKDVI